MTEPTMPDSLDPSAPEKEIIRRIEERGPITFAEFMEVALYSPEGGYYTSPRERWGPGGDYITSPDVSPAFSRCLAAQVSEFHRLLGSPDRFRMVEAGAGTGALSRGILDALRETDPPLYGAISVALVEKDPGARERYQDGSAGVSERVEWYEALTDLSGSGVGCIISNELIDSLPVHRVVRDETFSELYVGRVDDRFVDVPGPLSTPALAEYFEDLGLELARGQTAEVNLNAAQWLKVAAEVLESGFVVTIDYGLPARELYSDERMAGSLLCHSRHTLNDDPFRAIGAQDITSHVDFTTLVRSGVRVGLEMAGFTTQKNFLLGLGILNELREVEDLDLENYDDIMHNQALSKLIMPGGMGDTFKVLVQYKGLKSGEGERVPALAGFSFKEMSAYLE